MSTKTTKKRRTYRTGRVTSMETYATVEQCLSVLRSSVIFDEPGLYAIVCGYIFAQYALSPKIELCDITGKLYTSLLIFDRIATPSLPGGCDARVRFRFLDRPTFLSLKGDLDIGLCLKPTPYPPGFGFMGVSDCMFVTIRGQTVTDSPIAQLSNHEHSGTPTTFNFPPTCPSSRRLVHIDLHYIHYGHGAVMTVQVALVGSSSEASADLQYMIYSIRNTRFQIQNTFYPMLSSRQSLSVSIESLA